MSMRCTIYVLARESAEGFQRTLDSILRQDTDCCVDTAVVVAAGSQAQARITAELVRNPWACSVRQLVTPNGDLPGDLHAQGICDFAITIDCGDELMPQAIDLLGRALAGDGVHAAIAPVRYTDGVQSWSHASVDSLFALPSVVSDGVAMPLEIDGSSSGAIIAATDSVGVNCPQETVAVVKEYLCRRYRERISWDEATYTVPVQDCVKLVAPVHEVAFPGHAPALKRCEGVWLVGERSGEFAQDNGWVFFQYCRAHSPQRQCFYVLNSEPDCDVWREYRDNILIKGSARWRQALEQASHIFFTDTAADVLADATAAIDLPHIQYVYLSHGCLAYSPGVYQRAHQYIDWVVCASAFDVAAASIELDFPAGRFIDSGLPRWDRLRTPLEPGREILLCLTWRRHFDSTTWNTAQLPSQEDIQAFRASGYYQALSSLLQSPELGELLEEQDAYLSVSPHFRLVKYQGALNDLSSERVRLIDPASDPRSMHDLIQDACALITDYSSIMWDMAYLEKPVICYQFDKPSMLAERLKERFSLADHQLIAEVCYTQLEVIDALTDLAARQFRLTKRQRERIGAFIPHRDGAACERLVAVLEQQAGLITPAMTGRSGDKRVALFPSDTLPMPDWAGCAGILRGGAGRAAREFVALEPGTWRAQLQLPGINRVIVEPHLAADSHWGPVFFDVARARQFLLELASFARELGIESYLLIPGVLAYKQELGSIRQDFDYVWETQMGADDAHRVDISVVVPVFNGAAHIRRCIDSVARQKFVGSFEILVIDDGSTDHTGRILLEAASDYPQLTVMSQENAGQGMARNLGIAEACGEFVTFLDADDVLPRTALAELYNTIQVQGTQVAIGLVVSCLQGGAEQRVNQSYYHYAKAPSVVTAQSWPFLLCDPSCVGKLYRREFLQESGLSFPQALQEDQAFCHQLFSTNVAAAVTRQPVYFYLARPPGEEQPSCTQTFSTRKLEEILLVGIYCSRTLQASSLGQPIVELGMGFLVMRYDRFLWTRSQDGPVGCWRNGEFAEAIVRLERFLRLVDEALIVKKAVHLWPCLLLVKHNEVDLARRYWEGDRQDAMQFLENDAVLSPFIGVPPSADSFNYYRSVPFQELVLNDDGDLSKYVNEMSYGYRLGAPFVDALKSPLRVLQIPVRLLHLVYDVLTGVGRSKQQQVQDRLMEDSFATLVNHSVYIKLTAAYRLGTVLYENCSLKPSVLMKLPGQIRAIYTQTRPMD